MATAVQMTITLDSAGGVKGVNDFNKSIATIGPNAQAAGAKAETAFNGIESAERRAHIAGMLFARTTGVEMPRALETVAARSQALGPVLAALFNVSVFTAGAAAAGVAVEKIVDATNALGGYTEGIKKVEQETIAASRQAFLNPQTLTIARQHLDEVNKQIVAEEKLGKAEVSRWDVVKMMPDLQSKIGALLTYDIAQLQVENEHREKTVQLTEQQRQLAEQIAKLTHDSVVIPADESADLAGLQGFARIAQQKANTIADIKRKYAKDSITQDQLIVDAEQEAWGQSVALARQNTEQTISLRHQVVEDAATGEDRIKQAYADEIEDLKRKLAEGLVSRKDFSDRSVLDAQRMAEKIAALNDAAEKETENLERQARDAGLQGDDLILAHKEDMIAAITSLYAKQEISVEQYMRRVVAINEYADNQILAGHKAAEAKRQQILDQAAEDQKNAEETIVLASVSEWQRGNAQIEIEAQRRIAEINKAERSALQQWAEDSDQYVAIEAAAQAKREAVWAETDQKIREEHKKQVEQLGSDLESLFDDIAGGNLGKRIVNNMKKLFFQILAEWLMTTKMMNSGFGSMFGNVLFGPGSNGANFFGGAGGGVLGGLLGGGPGGTPPFMPSGGSSTSIFGGLFSGSSSTGLASGAGFGSFASSTGLGAFSSGGMSLGSGVPGAMSGTTGMAGNALTTQSIAAAAMGFGGFGGPAGQLAAPGLGGTLGGLKSMFSLQSLPGLAAMALMMGGGKLGGTAGQIGGMLSSLTIMAAMNPGGIASGLLGHLGLMSGMAGTLFAAAGPALMAFGLGQNFGPLGGTLIGAGAGAGMGALIGMAGGPIGMAIGAIVGAIAGLFGGLFGSGKRKRQANNYFDQQVGPAIKQIEDAYKSFQLDFTSANSQLEQLRSQAKDQLSKLKGEGKDVFKKKVSPAIDQAEKEISGFETERQRRAGLVWGPPQFHGGGLVNATIAGWTMKPGELLSVLKHGEFVVNPQDTARNLSTLQRINSGGMPQRTSSGHTIVLQVSALDAKSVVQWARGGGIAVIADELDRYQNREGN